MKPEFTMEEVAKHNQPDDLWIVINHQVYDVTQFARVHPGGRHVLLQVAGQDCTKQFYALHNQSELEKLGPKFLKGGIQGKKPITLQRHSDISEVPYAEANAFSKGYRSPYYNESHRIFKQAVRSYFEQQILPFVDDWEENAKPPTIELQKQMGSFGLLACCIQPGEFQKRFTLPGNIQKFDYFHELICHQEFFRLGAPGVSDSLKTGLSIGLPPVIKKGKPGIRDPVVMACLKGEKRIVLAITDPDAGSDVAGLTCTAVKSPCGEFYLVNGTKKWITNGTFADYFVTAVRTGPKGTKGISMLLIERTEGVSTRLIKTSYSPAAGTAYVTYENVKVPVDCLLGEENKGFELIMSNFNHERWMMACQVVGTCRQILEQCYKWTHQREAFGKALIKQPVIRQKLALMTANLESCEHWLENITYQMNTMDDQQQYKILGGPIALLKLHCTRMSQFMSDQACQLFGGRAITRTGMGKAVERFQKSFKFTSIYGGSEEIMADLGVKQAMRFFPQNAKL